MHSSITRRKFFEKSGLAGLAGVGLLAASHRVRANTASSANERLNIAVIGVANRGNANLNNVASQNIVALCDVDATYLAGAAERFPQAATYKDFRRVLDRNDIDAVVIATPDHTHAVAAVAALESGRHVYCEKPLARTISETRAISEAARSHNRVTQMGTQIHAGGNYRRVVELVQSGAIGPVREVHVWVGGGFGNKERPTDTPPVPEHLDYDLWLGPVPHRPYHPEYVPFHWRHWWAFGGGTLGDLGCHHMDLAHWALDLRHPLTARAEGPPVHAESAPHWLTVDYEYPNRGESPPVNLTWYHGGRRPPQFAEGLLPEWGDGTLFVGEEGMLLASYGGHVLLPEEKFSDFTRPEPFIPDSIGHHMEWIEACKNGSATTCNFDYSGALTEAVLLGNVAFRAGKKVEWDPENLRIRNGTEAEQFLVHQYRDGWSL
ncbi:MAG: Gfo/Idh/MocA family oxidoreductase [Opitutales bacterium]